MKLLAASLAVLCTAVLVTPRSVAQTAPATTRFQTFDVASVRENKTGDPTADMNFPFYGDNYAGTGGVLQARNLPLGGYIKFAYKLTDPQSAALLKQFPDWARSSRFDIEARVDGNPSKDDMRIMMRALLADRFQLKLHPESREIAILDLTLLKPGRTGPSMKPHPADDPTCLHDAVPAGFFSPCGILGFMPGTPVKAAGRNLSVQTFADSISINAGKPVIDKTGLTGNFDFTLEFVPESTPGAEAKPDETGATFLEALTEQAGLKLAPDRGTAVFYVLDHVERPSAN